MDYANGAGPVKMSIVLQQRKRIEDPDVPAHLYYGSAINCLASALAVSDPEAELDRMMRGATLPGQTHHFQQLRTGMRQFLSQYRPTRIAVASGCTWHASGLDVTVRQHVGMRMPNGDQHVVVLYVKEPALTAAAARGGLRIVETLTPQLLPNSTPRILDVRRGKLVPLRKNANRPHLDHWLIGEAAGYVAHWSAAA